MMSGRRKILLTIILLLLAIFGFRIKGCLDIDKCLDRGGRWNYEKGVCEYSETEQGKNGKGKEKRKRGQVLKNQLSFAIFKTNGKTVKDRIRRRSISCDITRECKEAYI